MIGAVLVCAGCPRKPALPPPDQVYTVRGVVTGLPTPDRPASELTIHHEAIPTFVNAEGKVVGMASMEMPFTPAQGVSLKELTLGVPVEFTLEVRWKPRVFSQVTAIRKLPPDLMPDFGAPKKPG